MFFSDSEAFAELKDVEECIIDPGCVCRRSKLLQYAQEHCRERKQAEEESEDSEKPEKPSAERAPHGLAEQDQATSREPRWRTRGHGRLIERAVNMCRNEYLKAWLREEGNTSAFLGLVDLFQMMKSRIYRERRCGLHSQQAQTRGGGGF